MEKWFAPVTPSPPPPASSVLVLAPHPDDEIFGCGGLLALYREMAAKIHVQVMTDGAGYQESDQRQSLFDTRKSETNQALARLELAPADFLGYADRSLTRRSDLRSVIKKNIQFYHPDVVLAPSLWEIHPDHLATARAALGAVAELLTAGETAPVLMFYEIGAPQRIDLLVDITRVWSSKHRAMQFFVSQNALQDYARHIEALNVYRTYTLPASVRYAEGYSVMSPQALAEQISRGGDLARGVMDRWTEVALTAATAHAEILQANMVAAQHNRWTQQQQIGCLQEQLLKMQQEATRLHVAVVEAQSEQQKLLGSNSWRMTAPLRGLTRFFRRAR